MSRYTVDPAQLQQVESRIGQASEHARGAVTALCGDVESLRWMSPAGVAWQHAWQDWRTGVQHLIAALDDLGRAVGMSGISYADTEAGVAGSMVPR